MRLGQNITEVLRDANPKMRVAQNITEVLYVTDVSVRIAQNVCEVLLIPGGVPAPEYAFAWIMT